MSSTSLDMTKIALIQMRCGAEPEKNLARAIEFIRDAARQGAEIVCLPELFRSQYFCQTEDHKNFDLAEEVPGKSTGALGRSCSRNRHANHCIAFRETQCRPLSQYRGNHRRRWKIAR